MYLNDDKKITTQKYNIKTLRKLNRQNNGLVLSDVNNTTTCTM